MRISLNPEGAARNRNKTLLDGSFSNLAATDIGIRGSSKRACVIKAAGEILLFPAYRHKEKPLCLFAQK